MPSIAQELIIEKFSGQTTTRQKIIETITQIHYDRRGKTTKDQTVTSAVKKALHNLKKTGIAENPSVAHWRIRLTSDTSTREVAEDELSQIIGDEEVMEQDLCFEEDTETSQVPVNEKIIGPDVPSEKVIGSGKGAVYLYYLPAYRTLAESRGESVWECKVGRTDNDPVVRVRSQASTAIPENPKISLIIRTDVPREMETAIHAILAARGKRKETAPGTEWFITHPSEVEEIHAFIQGGTSNTCSISQ